MATFNGDETDIVSVSERIPTLKDIKSEKSDEHYKMKHILPGLCILKKPNYIVYNNISCRDDITRRNILKREYNIYNYCLLSVCISFVLGLAVGVTLMGSHTHLVTRKPANVSKELPRFLNSVKRDFKTDAELKIANDKFSSVSFVGETHKYNKDIYPKGLTEDMKDILKDNKSKHPKHSITKVAQKSEFKPNNNTVLYDNVFWGPAIEDSMPQGYSTDTSDVWESYVGQSEVVKMESGCGRMQNRLVTFKDGIQACVRYRQNTDQIQGEIFSFYVAKLLNLTNLAPSVVKVVDTKDKLWRNVAEDIANAQWSSNRAVVLTQYIPSLESANIPEVFKPANRHLNKNDVLEMSLKENKNGENSKEILIEKLKGKTHKVIKAPENFSNVEVTLNKKTVDLFVELAQWSDLIIFDYLTANLDRIVNNLFNYQWNRNIMDGPAHNLARKMDSGLLLFLDNESGLLHGYRLLKKYNVYHKVMLDNLCVFRKSTISALKILFETQSLGAKLSQMFHVKNNAVIRDILPPLPEKNVKILYERIGKVLSQYEKCEQSFR